MNQFIITGRLTNDPDVKYTPTGYAIVNIVVAVDRWVKDEKKTDFPRITVYGSTAENMQHYTEKGSKVAIKGRIETNSYEKDGKKIYTTDLIADTVEFMDKRQKEPTPEFDKAEGNIPF